LVRSGTLEHFKQHPHFVEVMAEEPPRDMTLYPEVKYEGNAW